MLPSHWTEKELLNDSPLFHTYPPFWCRYANPIQTEVRFASLKAMSWTNFISFSFDILTRSPSNPKHPLEAVDQANFRGKPSLSITLWPKPSNSLHSSWHFKAKKDQIGHLWFLSLNDNEQCNNWMRLIKVVVSVTSRGWRQTMITLAVPWAGRGCLDAPAFITSH